MNNKLFQVLPISQIPPKGLDFDLTATPDDCKILQERFDLPAVKSLHVVGRIDGRDIIKVSGHITAIITQTCVVSMENFDSQMDVDFQEFFSEKGTDFSTEQDFDIDMDDEETVDLIQNGRLDLGEIVAQQFGLNLDPFPKKSEEVFEYIEAEPQETRKPFANLKDLLKK